MRNDGAIERVHGVHGGPWGFAIVYRGASLVKLIRKERLPADGLVHSLPGRVKEISRPKRPPGLPNGARLGEAIQYHSSQPDALPTSVSKRAFYDTCPWNDVLVACYCTAPKGGATSAMFSLSIQAAKEVERCGVVAGVGFMDEAANLKAVNWLTLARSSADYDNYIRRCGKPGEWNARGYDTSC